MVNAIAFGIHGDYHAALPRAEGVLPRARDLSDAVVRAWSLLAQAEVCLHADDDPARRALPLIEQARALPANEINKSEHFRIYANLAAVFLRSGDTEQSAQELDRALAILDSMVLPANWAFEGYANTPEVALALTDLPDLALAEQREIMQRAEHACAILQKFARAHCFARPWVLIFAGILDWHKGKHKKALKSWQKAAVVAEKFSMRYDIARAHFEIGRHLADGEQWETLDADEHLRQAEAIFAEIGSGYMLSRIEAHRHQLN
jgi:tetratricopeptide (TPR) repeat protein